MPDYLRLNTDALESDGLVAAYQRAATLDRDAKALQSAYRDELAVRLADEHGPTAAARMLDTSPSMISKHRRRHKERTMHKPAAGTEISTYFPGRGVPGHYPLLERVMDTHDMDAVEAHETIHALLDQLIALDGRDAVVLDERPIRPELVESNPGDVDVHHWLTVDSDAIEFIEDAIANAPQEGED